VFGPVQSLTATSQSESSITMTWEPPDDGGGAVDIKNYHVMISSFINQYTSETRKTLNYLRSNTRYSIDVAANGIDDRLGASMTREAVTRMLVE